MVKGKRHLITLGCIGIIVVVIVLLYVVFGSSNKDSRSFEGMQANDLYYVCRVSRTAPQIVFLEQDELQEFAELMSGFLLCWILFRTESVEMMEVSDEEKSACLGLVAGGVRRWDVWREVIGWLETV